MKATYLLAAALMSAAPAFADELKPRPGCGIAPGLDGWTVSFPSAYAVRVRDFPLEKRVPQGEILLYIGFKDVRKRYASADDIVLKDRNPKRAGLTLPARQPLPVVAAMTRGADGTRLDVVYVATGGTPKFLPVKSEGELCGDEIGQASGGQLISRGSPVILQGAPLEASTEDFSGAKTRSVSVILQKFEGPLAILQISYSVNGQLLKTGMHAHNALTGEIKLAGLTLQVKKEVDALILNGVVEPDNYYAWMSRFFQVDL